MKRSILILSLIAISYCSAIAGNNVTASASSRSLKPWLFKPLSCNDVSLEVERLDGNVLVYLYSQNMKNVDLIYVEKSKDPTYGFARCKTVKVSDHLIKSKNYINVVDDAPFDSNTDCYYRIRTVTAEGATKIYSAVSLSPILPIESETVDNGK